MVKWSGVFPAITTQFHSDGKLNLEATGRHIELLLNSGIHGLVVAGSLGENNTLLPEEKRALVSLAVEVVNSRVPVLSGVSETTTASACQYLRDIQALGADGAMVLPAMVYPGDRAEILHHFRACAKASDLPILLYNNPLAYANDITPEMFADLAAEEKFVAIKESSGDTRRMTEIRRLVGNRYTLFCGVDDLALEGVALGAEGWIAGVGIAFPEANRAFWNLLMNQDFEKARSFYLWYNPLLKLDIGSKFVQKIKLALQEVGLGEEWVRTPRLPLTGAEREEVLATVRLALQTQNQGWADV
ncbi:MAG: dihydrodipicolinate synthase family protein [Fimbriimonadaceae bacterium]|jgi:4-hydroxy-tetrahydrodipicolinate synthase|nr:dihydrodipicolinate synthase family protein [Fimbriimonadaceae bacterium]